MNLKIAVFSITLFSIAVHAIFVYEDKNASVEPRHNPVFINQHSAVGIPTPMEEATQNFTQNATQIPTQKRMYSFANKTQEAEYSVALLFSHLRSFIMQDKFDDLKFAISVEISRKLFLDTQKAIATLNPEHEKTILADKFAFCRHIFRVMEQACTTLRPYRFSQRTDLKLLDSVVDLNVRLLAMYNEYGLLDHNDPDSIRKLVHYWQNLDFWAADFQDLVNVPDGIRYLFKDQKAQAQDTMDDLWSQVKDQGKWRILGRSRKMRHP
ncbi:hypothetical protein JCM33374_g2235 [Metschnikowia sp. JCM 33374]|nr:hypothetical protein JCM33374_g2235 [Metschnikowia sp. JCM 33374]